jgi:hypothetical protein
LLKDWGDDSLNLVADDLQAPEAIYQISANRGAFEFSGNENNID